MDAGKTKSPTMEIMAALGVNLKWGGIRKGQPFAIKPSEPTPDAE